MNLEKWEELQDAYDDYVGLFAKDDDYSTFLILTVEYQSSFEKPIWKLGFAGSKSNFVFKADSADEAIYVGMQELQIRIHEIKNRKDV